MSNEHTIRLSRGTASKAAGQARDGRHEKATAPTQPIELPKRTPGPWTVGRFLHGNRPYIKSATGPVTDAVLPPGRANQEAEANAALIAAAPDMLVALNIAALIVDRSVRAGTAPAGALQTIRDAIAQATGVQS